MLLPQLKPVESHSLVHVPGQCLAVDEDGWHCQQCCCKLVLWQVSFLGVTKALESQLELYVCNKMSAEQYLKTVAFLFAWMRYVQCRHLYHYSLS